MNINKINSTIQSENNFKNKNAQINFKSAYLFQVPKELFINKDKQFVQQFFNEVLNSANNNSLLDKLKILFRTNKPKSVGFFEFPGYDNIQEIMKTKGSANLLWLEQHYNSRYGSENGFFYNKTKLDFLEQDENSYKFYVLTGNDNKFYRSQDEKIELDAKSFANNNAFFTDPNDSEAREEEEHFLKNISRYFDKMSIFDSRTLRNGGFKLENKFSSLEDVRKKIMDTIIKDNEKSLISD